MATKRQRSKNVAKTAAAAYMIRLHLASRRAANRTMINAVKSDFGHLRKPFKTPGGDPQLFHYRGNHVHTWKGGQNHSPLHNAFSSGYSAAARHPYAIAGVAVAGGAAYGGYRYHKHRKEVNMAKGKGKGSWKGGNAPAQGNTKRRVSRPEEGKHQGGAFGKGRKNTAKAGTSPKDGRKRGKK